MMDKIILIMDKISRRLLSNPWFLLLELFILYRPEFFTWFKWIDYSVNVLRVVFALILVALYMYHLYVARFQISKFLKWVIAIWGGYGLLCIITGTYDFTILIEFVLLVCVSMLAELYSGDRYILLDTAIHRFLLFCGLANILTIILGFDNHRLFFGFDNDISMRVIPLIGVMWYLSVTIYNRLRPLDYIITIIYLLGFVFTWSATAIAGLFVMCFIAFCRINIKYFNSKTIIAGSILIWIALFVFKVQRLLSFVLVALLHKDITLSYRMYIWKSVVTAISHSPIFGFGNIYVNETYQGITYPMYHASTAPHNFWLYICAAGGIIGVAVIIAFIVKSFRFIDADSNKPANRMLLASFSGYMLCGIFASYYSLEYLMLLLAIAYYSPKIALNRDRDKQNMAALRKKRPLKVLHLLSGGGIGGIERLCLNIAENSEFENIFCFAFDGGEIKDIISKKGYKILDLVNEKRYSSAKIKKAVRYCKTENVDAVILHHDGLAIEILYLCIIGRLNNIKRVKFIHQCFDDFYFSRNKIKRLLQRFSLQRVFQSSDMAVAVSKAVKASFVNEFKLDGKKINVLYNGISRQLLSDGRSNQVGSGHPVQLLYLGRLVQYKGLDLLLDAFAELSQKSEVFLTLVGDGGEYEKLKEKAKSLQIGDRVRFAGATDNVAAFYKSSQLFIYPSICGEAFGISIVEAMAYGLPCIVTPMGGMVEIVKDGINGFIAEGITKAALTDAIAKGVSLYDTDSYPEMSHNAKKTAERFTIDKTVSGLQKLLR